MILIKIELISAIHPSRNKELGRMVLTNDGTGTDKRCHYSVEMMRRGTTDKVQRRGMVMNYPRHAYTVWELVRRALKACLADYPIHPGTPQEFDEEVLAARETPADPCVCHNCGNEH